MPLGTLLADSNGKTVIRAVKPPPRTCQIAATHEGKAAFSATWGEDPIEKGTQLHATNWKHERLDNFQPGR
jgi:hypothetical protein